MGDRWTDPRDQDWRERDWRRAEGFERGGRGRPEERRRWDEDRSWSGAAGVASDAYDEPARDRRDDEEDGQPYGGRPTLTSGGAYGRGAGGGRSQAYSSGAVAPRFRSQDYTGRQPGRAEDDYRAQQGDARPAYGYREDDRRDEDRAWSGDGDRSYNRDLERRYAEDLRHRSSGGTGGYDYERGYGDAGRSERPGREPWQERREQGGGDFLSRAGERISSWFRGGDLMRGSRDEQREEGRNDPRRHGEDFAREARADRGHRGLGPKGYRRSDERISDEVHEHLTEDPWLDASNIQVEVKAGEVTLSGTVENREAKHRAERLIEDLAGVTHVQNNLRVDQSASLTGAGRGFGSSALEAEMRRKNPGADPTNQGASGRSGRTSTGAAAERSDASTTDGGRGAGSGAV